MSKLCVFLAILAVAHAFPAQTWEQDPEYAGGFFEGDLDLTEDQQKQLFSPIEGRNGLLNLKRRWPNNTVHFKITEEFDDAHYNHIITGLRIIESISCIRFLPAQPSTKAYINVTSNNSGCHSKVGFQDNVQQLNFQLYPLDSGCFRIGTIVHEFLHALGFYHQQSTHDRDDFVKIVAENIEKNKEGNFNIYDKTVVTDFGIQYDYGSVLHYSQYAFSKNGEKTIVPLFDEGSDIGQRKGLSPKDIYKLNLMYRCPNMS
ncbi:hypothetical protein ACFFRR_003911 [Megaselia abdita]